MSLPGREARAYTGASAGMRPFELTRGGPEGHVKLVRYAHASGPRPALLHEGQVVDPLAVDDALDILDAAARGALASMDAIIAAGAPALAALERASEAALAQSLALPRLVDVALLAPLAPPIILCAGSNYVDHNKEKAESPLLGREPEFFLKSPTCVI